MQSLNGHNLMLQQVPMVFSLHLVYLSTAACTFDKNKVGSMLAQGFLRVKSMQSLSGRHLMCQQVPMVFLL